MPEPADGLVAAALRAEGWAGEPFLHPGEDPASALAPGAARRLALDEALARDRGRSAQAVARWKVRFGLMLGLERVLSDPAPHLASGTELRRHQIDALAGMLAELIAANELAAEANGNGVAVTEDAVEEDDDDDDVIGVEAEEEEDDEPEPPRGRRSGRRPPLPLPPPDCLGQDDRRRRLRRGRPHARRPDPDPPPPARLAVRARPDHRGLRRPVHAGGRGGHGAAPRQSAHDPDLRLVRSPRRLALARRVPARDRRRGAHGARREDERRDPQLPGSHLHRDDGDRAADRQAGLGRLPGLGGRPAARRRGAARTDRTAALPARPARRRDPLRAHRRRRLRRGRPGRRSRPPGAQPGRGEPLPRPLRQHARDRLRRRGRACLQPRAGVPRRRDQGRGGERTHAAGQARRDTRRLRARRDQRADQRDAARGGLELAARDGRHAPRADRVEARLPAADRPHHAHASAQGSGHRRRLRAQGRDAQRARRLAPLAPRLRTSTARARASRPRPAAACSAARAAGSPRRRGSCRSPRTSAAGSP